jgi:hypothetical protein
MKNLWELSAKQRRQHQKFLLKIQLKAKDDWESRTSRRSYEVRMALRMPKELTVMVSKFRFGIVGWVKEVCIFTDEDLARKRYKCRLIK